MTRDNSKKRMRYYLPLTTAALALFSVAVAATAGGIVGTETGINAGTEKTFRNHSSIILKNRIGEFTRLFSAGTVEKTDSNVPIDAVNEQRIRFAAEHGVDDPVALVAAVNHSQMANLLISVAIEESGGDPVAVGKAGELGAWQVKACDWGLVPRDIHGQAGQAERIIRGLLIRTNGNKIKALAHYNGGTTPPGKSYRYAKRILKRARHLQAGVNHLPQNYNKLRTVLDPPGTSRMLTSFFNAGVTSNTANFLS